MPSTTNRNYSVPATGADPGLWGENDLNPNFQKIDTNLGATTSVALSSSNVTLSATQYACGNIQLTGTLSASVLVLFPNVQGWWTIENNCTVGAFAAIARCVTPGGSQIGIPPGEIVDVINDGTNFKYRNLGRIGSYMDLAVAAVPAWITESSVPPFLNCDGSTFDSGTYPNLATILGTTTLPDFRGRARFYLNGGTGRITAAASGIDGNTRFSAGGSESTTIAQANLPALTLPVTGMSISVVSQIAGNQPATISSWLPGQAATLGTAASSGTQFTFLNAASVTLNSQGSVSTGGSGSAVNRMPPACIGGITLIRAA